MLDAICPACGRGGSLPREKVNTRLVCRSCMQVFHVTPQNVAVRGEPPLSAMVNPKPSKDKNARKEKAAREDAGGVEFGAVRAPFKLAAAALVLVVVGRLAWPFVFSGPETLEERSIRLAKAILNKSDDRVEGLASTDTKAGVKDWLAALRPKLDAYRDRWPGHDLNVSALVIGENKSRGRAEVIAYYAPPMAVARGGDLLGDSSGKTQPLGVPLVWVLDQSDRWYLDAKESAKGDGGGK